MPTGYTSAIYEGNDVDFANFAAKCASGLGLFIDTVAQSSEEQSLPSSYYAVELAQAKAKLSGIEGWTEEQADSRAQEAYDRTARVYQEVLATRTAAQARYQSMLAQAQAWVPPTAEHECLKDFMIAQLEESIAHDCDMDGFPPPERPTAAAYKEQQLAAARRQVERCAEELDKVEKKAERRAEWVRELRESLADSSGSPVGA
jgi:multidrug efflux pump subunit AcrA (membrane-fusion protein)